MEDEDIGFLQHQFAENQRAASPREYSVFLSPSLREKASAPTSREFPRWSARLPRCSHSKPVIPGWIVVLGKISHRSLVTPDNFSAGQKLLYYIRWSGAVRLPEWSENLPTGHLIKVWSCPRRSGPSMRSSLRAYARGKTLNYVGGASYDLVTPSSSRMCLPEGRFCSVSSNVLI